jgi:hypothetical protein
VKDLLLEREWGRRLEGWRKAVIITTCMCDVVPSHSNTFFFRKMLMNVSEILNILRICN